MARSRDPVARRGARRPTAPRHRAAATLLWADVAAARRSLTRPEAAWIGFGGGFLLLCGAAQVASAVVAHSAALRADGAFWSVGLSLACFAAGAAAGLAAAKLALARAFAPCFAALPLSTSDRRWMCGMAAAPLGLGAATVVALAAACLCGLVQAPGVISVGLAAFAMSALGFAGAAAARVVAHSRSLAGGARGRARGIALPGLRAIDRPGLAWIGCWAWAAAEGRVRPGPGALMGAALVAAAVALSTGAGLAGRAPGPAVAGGVCCGVAAFALGLRYRVLASPVLRTAPLGFARPWLRIMRLPGFVSAAAFALPAGAVAASGDAAKPAAGALCLALLDVAYAVFAAQAPEAPLGAAAAFAVTLSLTAYESIEYGGGVLVGVAALLAYLWMRARRRFRRG